jgi:3'-phosphoadenosine 5'-phosphosulfate sulfotransferase (PAPS reductase)/FAD synthetase
MSNKRSLQDLQTLQALPLEVKVKKTEQRIREWVNEFGLDHVYVSFSGGKDSLALLHIARNMYPTIKAMHVNTTLEFPEIEKFVKTFDNVDTIKPELTFTQVIKKYGYPMISKEVAECVYGARKYLQSIIEQSSLRQTDRQTDRQVKNGITRSTVKSLVKANTVGLRTSSSQKSLEPEDIANTFKKQCVSAKLDKAVLQETSQTLSESELLKTLLIQDYSKAIDNLRVQRLMGINRMDGKATMETIPSDLPDRSSYSCERYQFMLDAPFEIGQQCCRVMKKNPAHKYCKDTGRMPITAQMASESRLRTQAWLKSGCNGFDLKYPISNPMSFWFDDDVLAYLKAKGVEPCEVYGKIVSDDEATGQMNFNDILGSAVFDLGRPELHTTGCHRTGCVACGFGLNREKTKELSRFQQIIDYSNPKICDWILRGGHFRESDGLWEPYQGLGLWFVIEWINTHGNFRIWYPSREHYLETYMTPETEEWLKQ